MSDRAMLVSGLERSDKDDDLYLACADARKQSILLREDAREYREVAEQVRAQSATLRARAAILLNS